MKYWFIGILLVLLVAFGWYYVQVYQVESGPEISAPVPAIAVQEPGIEADQLEGETGDADSVGLEKKSAAAPVLEELPLPELAESDPLARDTLTGLIGEAAVMQFFVNDHLVSRAVATIDALGSRQIPGAIQAVQGPEGVFVTVADQNPETVVSNETGDPIPQFVVDPANYQRYTLYVEMLEALDTDQLVGIYRSQYPLFQQAYRQMGYAEDDFDDRLREVMDDLLATPEVSEPVHLVKPEAYYLFTDEELEALPAGQKILIRMGNENAARVKLKLSEIRDAL